MAIRCPSCAGEMPDGMRFCGSCGTPLAPTRATGRERRLVSVLFCDLVGFTAFSEARDPEDVRDVLDQYFAAARTIIGTYGGTVEKFIGDAVMAVWGAPVAREDDAERAVRAGLGLTQAVAELASRLNIPELRVRVGVLTGEAAVEVGRTSEGMVTGDAVNTAARIQTLAAPGTVLVEDTTRLACERTIEFAGAGEHVVKGRRAPVRVWRALGPRREVGSDAAPRAIEPPMVGRDQPLQTIAAAVAGLLAPSASIRIVRVIGEVGIGKSRLARELERTADPSLPIRWHRGRSISFGEGSGLGALAEIVRMALGLRPDDPPVHQRTLVSARLSEWFAGGATELDRVARATHRLLDLDDQDEVIEQGELFSAWRRLFERLAAGGPVVLAFEEVQLADQALLDFFEHLREWSRAAPILVLAFSRPDPRQASLEQSATSIELRPLSDYEMDELVEGAVDGAPQALRAAIRADGGGIPLFAVETLRALADRGILAVRGSRYVVTGPVGEMSVPPTVRAIVASRLDRLGQAERAVLMAGAVLGERFEGAAAAAVADVDPVEAPALIGNLVAKAFLVVEDDPRSPDRGHCVFVQGVVRRVALASLSRRERKRLHLAAVERLSNHTEPPPDLAVVLAGHLLAAQEADPGAPDAGGIADRARTMLGAAAERAAAVGAPQEALSLFDRAAELATDDLDRATTLERAATVAYRAGNMDAAATRFRTVQDLHEAAGRERQRLRARAEELRSLRYVHAPAELLPALRELDGALAGERDGTAALVATLLAFTLYQCGLHQEALEVGARAEEIAEASAEYGELVHALGGQGAALQELGRPRDAIAVQRRALVLAERHDRRRVAPLEGNLAIELASIGLYAEAVEHARRGIAAAERGGERLFERHSRLVLGRALCSLGHWDEAVAEVESVKDDIPPFQVTMAMAPLVVIALARGQDDRVLELVAEHDRRCAGEGTSVFESDFRVLRAATLVTDPRNLAALVASANTSDYAEWTGWLSPIVDRLVAQPEREPLDTALSALQGPGEFKRTAPVVAQAERLQAHLTVRSGELDRAARHWREAARLTSDCGLAFERAVIALEMAEHAVGDPTAEAALARATFERLGATPWLERSDALR